MLITPINARHELLDCLRLVAHRHILRDKFKIHGAKIENIEEGCIALIVPVETF